VLAIFCCSFGDGGIRVLIDRNSGNDIFFTPSSEVPNDIAKSSVAMESIINGVYSYHLVRLRMFKSLDLKFRTYMFKTNSFFKIVSKLAQGSGTRYTITLPSYRF
jgi:restriction endonuclease S subunit